MAGNNMKDSETPCLEPEDELQRTHVLLGRVPFTDEARCGGRSQIASFPDAREKPGILGCRALTSLAGHGRPAARGRGSV